LLRDVPRTATVTAPTPATVYQLNREPFLTAALGHAPTHRQAARITNARLASGAAPLNDRPQEGTAEPPLARARQAVRHVHGAAATWRPATRTSAMTWVASYAHADAHASTAYAGTRLVWRSNDDRRL
jgi:hypothetical protein